MKKILLSLLVLLLAVQGGAQTQATFRSVPLQMLRDLDSTSYEYCRTLGRSLGSTGQANAFRAIAEPQDRAVRVATVTTGSTTISASVAGTNPFLGMVAGDILVFPIKGYPEQRVIVTATSDDATVVNRTINLHAENTGIAAGTTFQWRDLVCGAETEDGWVAVANAQFVKVVVAITQLNVTGGIDVKVECRENAASQPIENFFTATNVTAVGTTTYLLNATQCDEVRVGTKIGSADDGGDLTTNAEQVSVTLKVGTYQ